MRTVGPSSPEVTRVICRVPSIPFSQAPEYTQLVHLCRFRVRPIRWGSFLESDQTPSKSNNLGHSHKFVTTNRLRNINRISIDYAFRPHLRSRLTLRGLTLRRNPWTFGESVSHTLYRYLCQHSHFRYLQLPFRVNLHRLTERSATTCNIRRHCTSTVSVRDLIPVTFSAQADLSRPVSYYAFFKGWLLLSQPPGCLGLPTSFPT